MTKTETEAETTAETKTETEAETEAETETVAVAKFTAEAAKALAPAARGKGKLNGVQWLRNASQGGKDWIHNQAKFRKSSQEAGRR